MIRLFVEDEFKKDYANQEGSIMRGNTLASKLTKAYLSIKSFFSNIATNLNDFYNFR